MKTALVLIGGILAIAVIAIIATLLLAFILGMLDGLQFGDLMQEMIYRADELGDRFGEKINRIVRRDEE